MVQEESHYKKDPSSAPSFQSKDIDDPVLVDPPTKKQEEEGPSAPSSTTPSTTQAPLSSLADETSESSPETLHEEVPSGVSTNAIGGTKNSKNLDTRDLAELDEDSEDELDKFHEDEEDDYDNGDEDSDIGTSSHTGSHARNARNSDEDETNRDVSQQSQQNSVWIVRFFSLIFGSIGSFFSKLFKIFEFKRDASEQQQ